MPKRVEGARTNVPRAELLELWAELEEILHQLWKLEGVPAALREINARIAARAAELDMPAELLDQLLVAMREEES